VEQHKVPVWELKGVVLDVWLVLVDSPKLSYLHAKFLATNPTRKEAARVLNLLLERDFCAGKETHCYVRFSDRYKTTREGVVKLRRHQFVSDLCRSGGDEV
jgi:hypothetical protein